MKTVALILLVSLAYTAAAQDALFVRVYDLQGNKIHKGRVFATTGSSLEIQGNNGPINMPMTGIGHIKTKRSGGHNVLIGSLVGLATFAIVGAASATDEGFITFGAGEGAAGGAAVGIPIGALIGGLSILFKNSKEYAVNGDPVKWQSFRSIAGGRNSR